MIAKNNQPSVAAIVGLFLILTLFACEYEQREVISLDSLPEEISFSEHIVPIFSSKCIKCHNGTTPPNLAPEEAYIEIIGAGYVNIDEPEESNFYKKIDGGTMTQYASDEDRAFILKWIIQGAADN